MRVRCFSGPFNGLVAEVPNPDGKEWLYRVALRDIEARYELGRDGRGGMLLCYTEERQDEPTITVYIID
jgi:hypothetical protein